MDKLFSRWKERHIGYEEKLLNLDGFCKKGVCIWTTKHFFFLSGSYSLIESFFNINVSSSSKVMYISWIDWDRKVFQLHWMYIWDISFIFFFVLILLNLNFLIWTMFDLDLDALICKLHVVHSTLSYHGILMQVWVTSCAWAGITEVIFVSWFSLLR